MSGGQKFIQIGFNSIDIKHARCLVNNAAFGRNQKRRRRGADMAKRQAVFALQIQCKIIRNIFGATHGDNATGRVVEHGDSNYFQAVLIVALEQRD